MGSGEIPPEHHDAALAKRARCYLELRCCRNPTDETFDVVDACAVDFSGTGRHGRVLYQNAKEFARHGFAQRPFDADIDGDADYDQRRNPSRSQVSFERGSGKATRPRFANDDFSGRWSCFVDDGEIPGTFGEDLAGELRMRPHVPQRWRFVPPGRALRDVVVVAGKTVLRMDDQQFGRSGSRKDAADCSDGGASGGQIEPDFVEVAAGAAECILHVVDDNRRGIARNLQRLRPCRQLNARHRQLAPRVQYRRRIMDSKNRISNHADRRRPDLRGLQGTTWCRYLTMQVARTAWRQRGFPQ